MVSPSTAPGHLIHLKNPYTKELVASLLPDAFNSHERLAAIYSKQTTTPYPFQANTYGLPPEVVKECVVGFVETLQAPPNGGPKNFHDWIVQDVRRRHREALHASLQRKVLEAGSANDHMRTG